LSRFQQVRLVVFEGQQIVGAGFQDDLAGGLLLRVHGVQADQPTGDGEACQQAAGGGNLVFLLDGAG
jgi:hypothetical protein